jgi:hypothetical protein
MKILQWYLPSAYAFPATKLLSCLPCPREILSLGLNFNPTNQRSGLGLVVKWRLLWHMQDSGHI